MVGLRLFGAIHADRRRKVASEFARVADGVDAVFVEYPVDGFGFERAFRALARAPLAALGMLLVSVVQWPLYALLVRSPLPAEIVAAREYAADNDLDVHAVDDHPIATLATAGPRVAVPNWLATLGLAAFDPLGSLLAAVAVVGAWLVGSLLVRVHRLLWAAAVPFLTAGFGWVILGSTLVSDVLLAGCVLAGLAVGAGYYALPEARWGKTVGKKLFGLVVVDTEGRPISPFAAGFRTFLRLLDLPTLYLLVLVDVWDGRQRFGDRAADTVVARAGSGGTDETDRAE